MFYLRFIAVLLLSLSAANAQQAKPVTGAEILTPFKKNLQQALLSGLAESPEQAIQVCSIEAPQIADSISVGNITVGRTSDRLRNPDNNGPDWVIPILDAYINSTSEREPQTVALSNNKTGYAEPIILQPVCLTCHGSQLSSQVTAAIDEVYPDDRATDYQVGDLRGVFWVEYQ